MRKYYEAYDERYKAVHKKNLRWRSILNLVLYAATKTFIIVDPPHTAHLGFGGLK